jgi:hypothetical protein
MRNKIYYSVLAFWLLTTAILIGFWGAVAYVVIHFIRRVW